MEWCCLCCWHQDTGTGTSGPQTSQAHTVRQLLARVSRATADPVQVHKEGDRPSLARPSANPDYIEEGKDFEFSSEITGMVKAAMDKFGPDQGAALRTLFVELLPGDIEVFSNSLNSYMQDFIGNDDWDELSGDELLDVILVLVAGGFGKGGSVERNMEDGLHGGLFPVCIITHFPSFTLSHFPLSLIMHCTSTHTATLHSDSE